MPQQVEQGTGGPSATTPIQDISPSKFSTEPDQHSPWAQLKPPLFRPTERYQMLADNIAQILQEASKNLRSWSTTVIQLDDATSSVRKPHRRGMAVGICAFASAILLFGQSPYAKFIEAAIGIASMLSPRIADMSERIMKSHSQRVEGIFEQATPLQRRGRPLALDSQGSVNLADYLDNLATYCRKKEILLWSYQIAHNRARIWNSCLIGESNEAICV